ncbi:MAG: 3-deoxy-D-arabino-heptulosonate-7-phosphate synthase, phenylalanine repressible [Pseudomonadota bacterium]|jgi:3-deoxy-7-phosphoheptulonate synthase
MSAIASVSEPVRGIRAPLASTALAIPTPAQLKERFSLAPAAARTIESARAQASELVQSRDDRLLCVVGPCSIHEPESALEYAARLAPLARRHASELLIVMRVYLEKPRSTVGWKGLISDPHLDGRCDIGHGLCLARELMTQIANLELPMASELLDGNLSSYFSDLLTWAAIGARTTESQPHRELASSLQFPVGFKNGTDGRIEGALGGMVSAARSHRRLAPDDQGWLRAQESAGNAHCHLTLRGGSGGPNYDAASVRRASESARSAGLPSRVLVDCSHGNSGKDHENQPHVAAEVAAQVSAGGRHVLGVMIESHLVAGRQALSNDPAGLRYGQSITDACVDFPSTEAVLEGLAAALRAQRAAAQRS